MDIRIRVDIEVHEVMIEDARYGRFSARGYRSRAKAFQGGKARLPFEVAGRRRYPAAKPGPVRKGMLMPDGTIVWLN